MINKLIEKTNLELSLNFLLSNLLYTIFINNKLRKLKIQHKPQLQFSKKKKNRIETRQNHIDDKINSLLYTHG